MWPVSKHIHWPILFNFGLDGVAQNIHVWCRLNPNHHLYIYSTKLSHLNNSLTPSLINMDACFLSHSSFTKTTDQLFPTTRTRSLAYSKRSSQQFHYRKPFHVSCCQFSSSSPLDDDKPTLKNADWRSFRAKLVAGEQLLRPEVLSSVSDLDNTPLIGDKWAHIIHEPERGCLLIATEKLDGVHIFERTVILLLSTGPIGPTGIILNRPSLMSIKETRSTAFDVAGTFSNSPLFFGGPLEEGLFLLSPNQKEGSGDDGVGKSGVFEEVMKGLYYGTKESVGCAAEMVKRDVVEIEDFRFFDGYCGWEKEQLKDEIRAGYWTVAACSPSVVGLGSVGIIGLWDEVLGLMRKRKVR